MNTGQYRAHHGLKKGEGTRNIFLPPMSMGVAFMNSVHETQVRNGADPIRSIQETEKHFAILSSNCGLHAMALQPVDKKARIANEQVMEANRAHDRAAIGCAPAAKRLRA
eukprot:jgi/Mesvir1/28369/Mv11632-RA.1